MLELAQAAKQFGLNPAYVYGIDTEQAEPALVREIILICSLRLMLWDAYLAEKQAEAMKNAQHSNGVPDQQPTLAIPEYPN